MTGLALDALGLAVALAIVGGSLVVVLGHAVGVWVRGGQR